MNSADMDEVEFEFEFKFKYWAGSTADVPRGIAQKFTIIIIIIT